jgi:hypothetical protein
MADERNEQDESQELVYGGEIHTFTYPPPVPCGECGGTGKIALLVTARACGACQGTGQLWPEPLDCDFTPHPHLSSARPQDEATYVVP